MEVRTKMIRLTYIVDARVLVNGLVHHRLGQSGVVHFVVTSPTEAGAYNQEESHPEIH